MQQATTLFGQPTPTTVIEEPRNYRRRRRKKQNEGGQANLLGKTFSQLDEEKRLKGHIEVLTNDLAWIEHFQTCKKHCFIELVIGIERYLGSRLPWYLNLQNGLDEGFYEGCPQPENFEIGWYGNDNAPGTTKFIKARLKWAKKFVQDELENTKGELESLMEQRGW